MLTEEEAKTKWCPFAMALRGDGAAVNRDTVLQTGDVDCRCIASECMAWRFYKLNGRFMQKDQKWHEGPTPESVGFCGLAGMMQA